MAARTSRRKPTTPQGVPTREYPSRPFVGVGVVLFRDDEVLLVKRAKPPISDNWSIPGGAQELGETVREAALRELKEETGIRRKLVERIATHPQQLKYDIPEALANRLWGGKWKGQLQDWYLCRFLGDDGDVNIATKHPEFNDWKWVEPAQLPDLIVPFKRDLYRRLLAEFGDHL